MVRSATGEDKRKASKKMKQKLAQCCDVELTFNFKCHFFITRVQLRFYTSISRETFNVKPIQMFYFNSATTVNEIQFVFFCGL